MALDYCNACGSIEGGFRAITPQEAIDVVGPIIAKEFIQNLTVDDNQVCLQCHAIGEKAGLAESGEE